MGLSLAHGKAEFDGSTRSKGGKVKPVVAREMNKIERRLQR